MTALRWRREAIQLTDRTPIDDFVYIGWRCNHLTATPLPEPSE